MPYMTWDSFPSSRRVHLCNVKDFENMKFLDIATCTVCRVFFALQHVIDLILAGFDLTKFETQKI